MIKILLNYSASWGRMELNSSILLSVFYLAKTNLKYRQNNNRVILVVSWFKYTLIINLYTKMCDL